MANYLVWWRSSLSVVCLTPDALPSSGWPYDAPARLAAVSALQMAGLIPVPLPLVSPHSVIAVGALLAARR